jgi:polar amino acid transport system substrate-binding protein
MKTRGLTLLLSLLLTVSLAAPAAAATLTVASDEWCPYICEPGSAREGFGIEIMKAIFEPQGIKIEYSVMDWDEALKETGKNKFGAVLGGFREDTPGFALPDEEIGMSVQVALVKKGAPWKFDSPASLGARKVGMIEGYTIGGGVDEYLDKHQAQRVVVGGNDPLADLLRKLLLGEVDVVFEDSFVFALKAREMGLIDKIQESGRLTGKPVYVAFAPGLPESKRYAAAFNAGMRELRSSMRLAGILKKYGIADWKKP